jgi:transposase
MENGIFDLQHRVAATTASDQSEKLKNYWQDSETSRMLGWRDFVLEQRVGTTPKATKEVFGGMPRSRIALETGMHFPWVSRVLSELGHEVIVAHARNVRLIGESRRKDDRLDARTLARLVRIDPQLLCPLKHRSAKAQVHLTVIRARAGLVRKLALYIRLNRSQ